MPCAWPPYGAFGAAICERVEISHRKLRTTSFTRAADVAVAVASVWQANCMAYAMAIDERTTGSSMRKTYLVTGGCGFIGSHLCAALVAEGHHVRVLDDLSGGNADALSTDVQLMVGDVTDPQAIGAAMADVDGCFHLAAVSRHAYSLHDPISMHHVNLDGAMRVFEAAGQQRVATPVVYASSAAVYGDNASVPLGEHELPRPLTMFGADKVGCEHHARVASLVNGVPTTGFRMFNVFGPRLGHGRQGDGVIPTFVDQLFSGQALTIFNDGQQSRDFIYIEDVVRFLLAGMAECRGGAHLFNVCTGSATTIVQLARTICSLYPDQTELEYRHVRNQIGDVRMSIGDPRRALRLLNIGASVTLADALRGMIRTLDPNPANLAA